jgi:hypothetical protein
MSVHSVPCWRSLDKVSEPFTGIDLAVLLSSPVVALQMMSMFFDQPARLAAALNPGGSACFGPADPDNPAVLESGGSCDIQTPSLSPLTLPIPFINRVRIFARSSAHFRTKQCAYSHEVNTCKAIYINGFCIKDSF